MEIDIISFGKISEFIKNQRVDITGISDTDALKIYLEKTFPEISQMKYKLALNENLIQQNTQISGNDLVAIMPPFSGG
ncbi:MoaD/ThiS family protein [Pedobacter gandavensis]|uniref:Molybdopterin synthase sulfur carrier subunit n=1 Tax=Pedobacter gandavensis TaxID=2679963 RepID=A0ABR6ES05_9SPHI|nr:MoaD/ThiS family protein [Pedobacter gandavensis]MBB2148045.1 molybdopterin synthase sulfur carrier subunit [Pedobacter gandavensis]